MSLEWMLIRGSGLVAFGLLAAATIWGLVLSLGVLPRSTKRLTFLHESLSVGALLATCTHMVALYLHDFLEFSAVEVLVPGASDWRPVAVAWGGVAFYGMVLVTVSFYLRAHIGQRNWRLLHFAAFGVFGGAAVHGVMAGTDTTHPAVMALYVGTVAIVIGLIALRLLSAAASSRTTPDATAARTRPSGTSRAAAIAAAREAADAASEA